MPVALKPRAHHRSSTPQSQPNRCQEQPPQEGPSHRDTLRLGIACGCSCSPSSATTWPTVCRPTLQESSSRAPAATPTRPRCFKSPWRDHGRLNDSRWRLPLVKVGPRQSDFHHYCLLHCGTHLKRCSLRSLRVAIYSELSPRPHLPDPHGCRTRRNDVLNPRGQHRQIYQEDRDGYSVLLGVLCG